MFLEQVFNPLENRPTPSKEEIDTSFDNFYGKGERPLALPDDMSGQYNTQLSPDEESAYQAWAKGQGREKDVFNYDLRGAWKELQSGTMSEDERGHLGDKYKKPNHPTFSTESIYNGKDGYQGGVWSREGNVDVYTPQHKLTPEQAKRLRLYFAQNEEGVALNLKDKVYDNPTIQLAPKSVGAFDGLAKGILYPIPNVLVRMGSGALMVASKAMPWVRDDFLKQMEQASLDLDKWNRANFGANPETMGKATQVIHGLVGMLAELGVLTTGVGGAAGLAIKGVGAAEKLRKTSIAVGSALFGTDIGISERNRLVAEGVDEDTAFKAGAVSGLLNIIGAAIPPFLGSSRTWSAMYGAGSNVALNYAELSTISYVLDHQDYTELAKQYELNMVDMLVSAGVGAFMGTVFWRNPVDVKYDRAHQRVYERYKSDLEAGGKFSQEEIESQAKLNAAAAVSYARMAHIAPDQVDDMATKLVWTDDRKAFAVPEEYAMPITQGSEWHMGPSPKRNAEEQIPVLKITEAPLGRKDAIAYTTAILKDGVKNKDSGFVLTASRSDMKKAAGERGGLKERVFTSVAKNIDKIAENSVLVESHVDVKHRNPNVQGVHIFAMPVEFDGSFWRVQLLVKDVIEPGNEKTAVHTIDGIEINKMENPPVGITQSEGGVSYVAGVAAADNRQVHNVTDNVPNDRTVSLSQLLGGDNPYIRQDGKGFFDSPDVLQAINNAADITDPVFARITESDPHYRYQSYARVAGEVEARNAQTRKDMTPEERAETLLRDTESVPRNEQIITSREYLQKGQEGIRGAFNPSTNTIRLTPNANLSTFSHEHAHWYLTNTLALGGKEGAPLELQSQINAILHAFGLKSINEWNALGFEGQRKYQEQFAAWTEIYLTQGKSPVKELEGVFAKMAEWLIGMYEAALGKDAGPDAAVREVSDRYQAQFGEKLPELSPEVRKVLDTMYGAQQKRSAFKSSKAQTMAGRLVQAQRVNQTKVSAPISDPHGPTAGNVGQAAQGKAVSDLNNGRKVDVSEQVGDTEANVPVVEDTQSTFARGVSIGDGDNSRVVVLQNRNRSDPNSVAQMNSIATDPQYGRLSTSRTTQSGAPIVSFGHLPDKAYQGKSEIITESNGNKVPVTYYVVEADDVMRSNNYDGTPNKEWNNDNPDQMRAIAGNGRMAGLSEAYNRGTAEQYRQDLMADSDNHGVSPETIKGMKKPVLVRYMPPDRVTTGFVERSNTSDVLVRSSLETAVQDSPKVRKNIGKYEFDEDGDPTKETLGQFLTDVGEVSEMGNLIDSNGNPTTAARARIKAAVFYEAYRDKRLTELIADSEDKHGIKRILSAMSAFAPHVIQIRETSGGAIDLAPIITDATHRILQARINGEGVDFTAQGDMFSSNPATEMVTNFLSQNRNSAAAMLRVLRPFAEQVENALQAADSPMFADLAVKTDLADAMALFRKAENQEIRNRSGDLLGDADGKLLPEIDVEAMRSSLANTLKDGKNLVDAISEGVAETNRMATPEAKAEAQQQHLIEQQNAREVLSENSEAVRARNFALEDPNRELVMTDENGNDVIVTAQDAMAKAAEIDQDLNDSTAGLGMGVACIIRNQGIR